MRDQPTLIEALHRHVGNFENALDEVAPGDDRKAMESAVTQVFGDQERAIGRSAPPEVLDLLRRFGRGPLHARQSAFNTGYVFTLNQDRFIENLRALYTLDDAPVSPGVNDPVESAQPEHAGPFTSADQRSWINVSQQEPSNVLLKGKLNYIKLHGSFRWRLEDSHVLVMGGHKARQIEQNSLLAFYATTFERVLERDGMQLMVIGYSFGDEHINAAIAHAIRTRGLELFVVDTRNAVEIRNNLSGRQEGDQIFRAIRGFSHAPLSQTLKGQNTPEFDRIKGEFFDSQ